MAYSNKMIKEDHLLACTTRMSEIFGAQLPSGPESCDSSPSGRHDLDHPSHLVHRGNPDTHPRGCPTIHLSKSTLILRRRPPACSPFFIPSVRLICLALGERIIPPFRRLSIDCREDFLAFATPDSHPDEPRRDGRERAYRLTPTRFFRRLSRALTRLSDTPLNGESSPRRFGFLKVLRSQRAARVVWYRS